MKKILAIMALAMSGSVFANSYVSVDVENVSGREGQANSQAQYVRAGKEIAGLQFGLQSRTAKVDNGGLLNSLELTAGKKFGGFTPFVGVGHDNGFNGAPSSSYNYGLVGATYGMKMGPGFALAGVKTRVRADSADPKQTVTFAQYSIPVAKNISVNLGASHSAQDIKEKGYSLGLSFGF